AALVELAVVFPVLLTIIMGMVEMGRLGMVAQLMTTAARDGCRVAVINAKTQTDVENRISSVLTSGGIKKYTISYSPATWTSVKASDSSNFISVTVTTNYSDVTWLPSVWFLKGAKVTGAATLSSERQ